MLVDPSVDELLDKKDDEGNPVVSCKYELVSLLAKRARVLMEKKPEYLESTGMHPVTLAAKEIVAGKVLSENEG